MNCKKCNSTNIQVIADTKGKVHGGSLMQSLGRLFLILCTAGLWLLVPKGRGKIKTRTKAVCMNCSNQWYI